MRKKSWKSFTQGSSNELILAVDAGVSVNRAILFDKNGNIIDESRHELKIEQPKEGWAEQKPEVIWNFTRANIRNVIDKTGVSNEDILAVGITAHMHGTFLLDQNGNLARRNAIVWVDARTGDILNELTKNGIADRIFEISGWQLITSMQSLHLKWIKENERDVFNRTNYFMACKDYLRYRLTGEVLSDFTDASFTGLFDNIKCKWSSEAFHLLGIDPSIAPELKNAWEVGGYITEDVSKETGLKLGIPVTVGSGDVAAMALGAGVTEENQLMANIGAAGVYERPVEKPIYDRENRSYQIALHAIPGKWLLQANQMSAALSLRWFRDNIIKGEMSFKDFDELVSKSPPGANGIIFHPFLQGERSPFVNPNAKGIFFGLTLKTDLRDIVRAIFEGVAFSAKDNLNLLTSNRGTKKAFEITMGGGAANSNVWVQILSDTTGYTVRIPKINEVGALGAAILGSLISKLYSSHKESIKRMVKSERQFDPNIDLNRKYEQRFGVYKSLYRTLKPFYA